MTETDLHVPSHIQMTIRIAAQEQQSATAWTVREAELRGQVDEHQRDAAAERERIEAELQAARADAERRLNALADVERKLTAELAEAGRCKEHHGREALDAQQSLADWCTRHGVRPDELPQPDGTGPLPVVPAPIERAALPAPQPAENSQPLPVIPDPSGLLALGKRMADPGATVTDPPAGGEPPAQGDFQGEADRA